VQGKLPLKAREKRRKLRAGERVPWRNTQLFRRFSKGRKDGRNSPKRIRDAPVSCQISPRSREGTAKVSKGSKLRKGRSVDRDHEDCWIYSWIGISGVRESRLQIFATISRDIVKRDTPTGE